MVLAACGQLGSRGDPDGASKEPPGTSGKPVVLLDSSPPPSLDSAVLNSGIGLLKYAMSENLVSVSRKVELEPWLATSWRNLDPLKWEIKLREGVKFWDGTPMDAAAVKASLERLIGKHAEARLKLAAAAIDVVDPRTLVITTLVPNASFPNVLSHRSFGIHNAKAAEAIGDEAFARQPVLTGPFKPVEYKKDELLTVTRNDGYWGGKPYLPGFQVKFVIDPNTRILALQSGDADLVLRPPIQALDVLRNTKGLYVKEVLSEEQFYVLMNGRTAPTDDARVRRAISLGIDRRALVDQVLNRAHDVATDIYAPMYPWTLKNGYPTDAAKAAALLDDAGWRPGTDGVRRKDGKTLTLTLLHYPQNSEIPPMAVAIQAQLKKLGVNAELKSVEQINPATKTADWNAAMYSNNTGGGDPLYMFDDFFRPEGGQQFGFSHPEIPKLIDQIQTTMDPTRRLEAIRRAQDFLVEQAPMVPLVAAKIRVAVSERLKNVQAHPVNTRLVDANFGK